MLGLLAFSIACRLTTAPELRFDRTHASVADAVLGEVRTSLSAACFEMADLYFHRGVGHIRERAFDGSVYERLHDIVAPRGHVHLRGPAQIREIMPWLLFSLRADPRNVDAYLVAAFWLAYESGQDEAARDVLIEGQRNNPFCARIQLELGRLYVHRGDLGAALQAFNAALAFWDAQADHSSDEARKDRVQGLLYRAMLNEAAGSTDRAVTDLEALVTLAPDPEALHQRLRCLRDGVAPPIPARELLAHTTQAATDTRHACAHENARGPLEHHDHDHHDDRTPVDEQARGAGENRH